jgi:hypothetical protein
VNEAPDFIEPFEVWRAWKVVRRNGVYSLGSIVRGTLWPAREALARIGQYVAEPPCRGVARVLGRVALWGTVIECERGFRASHAYPARIYVPADAGDPWRIGWEEVAFGLARYGVPIEPLAARASEATHHLAERLAA